MTDVSPSGIITPEAVILDLPAAGVATRLGAKVVDLLLLVAIAGFGGFLIQLAATPFGPTVVRIVAIVWGISLVLGAPMLCEGLWNGRTPGKAAFGLRVVTLDGGPIQWRHAFLRSIAQVPDIFLLLGIFPALATRRSQRFGDLMAGTFVLVDAHGGRSAQPIAFLPPPGWEQYVYTLDVSRLRPEQYRLIRTFLLRVSELLPRARWELAVRIAEGAGELVAPLPAGQVDPEQFLVAVASAYQHRNGGIPRPDQIIGYPGLPR